MTFKKRVINIHREAIQQAGITTKPLKVTKV